jgi:hypothetical protein
VLLRPHSGVDPTTGNVAQRDRYAIAALAHNVGRLAERKFVNANGVTSFANEARPVSLKIDQIYSWLIATRAFSLLSELCVLS